MKKVISFAVVAVFVLVLGVLAVPAFASDDFNGTIIPPNAVLYHTDGMLTIIEADADGNWNTVLSMTDDALSQVAAAPAVDTLVTSEANLSLYKLTSGEWQINTAPDAEGKVHVVVFDAGWGSYHSYDLNSYGDIWQG